MDSTFRPNFYSVYLLFVQHLKINSGTTGPVYDCKHCITFRPPSVWSRQYTVVDIFPIVIFSWNSTDQILTIKKLQSFFSGRFSKKSDAYWENLQFSPIDWYTIPDFSLMKSPYGKERVDNECLEWQIIEENIWRVPRLHPIRNTCYCDPGKFEVSLE